MTILIPIQRIEKHIFLIRGQKVMLASHLAELYEVSTKALNQAVKRNIERFPEDFMFQLSWQEATVLNARLLGLDNDTSSRLRRERSTLKSGANFKYLPYAFTEYGVGMLSSVLKSRRAVQVNIEIMRAFGKLREILSSHKDLARKLVQLENKYDHQFKVVFDAIRQLMEPPVKSKKSIGFKIK